MPEPKLESTPPNSPSPSASDQSPQQPERQRFEQLLQRIQQQAKVQGQENAVLTIQAGRPVIYKGVPDQEPVSKHIPIETIQKVLKAVEQPQALNVTVKISVNGKVAFYNQKGELSQDAYKLAKQHQVAQETKVAPQTACTTKQPQTDTPKLSPPQQRPASAQEKSQPQTATPAKLATTTDLEQLKGRIDQLEALVAKQQKHIHHLEQRTNMIGSAPILAVNNKLGNWLEDIRNQVGKTLQQTGHHLSKRLEQDKALLQSYRSAMHTVREQLKSAHNQVQTAYDQAVDRHYAAHHTALKAVTEVASGVAAAANQASAVVAKQQNQPTHSKGNNSIKERPTFEASALWKHYSQKVTVTGPFQTAIAVARTAWREGVSEPDIRKMLSANPALEQFGKKAQDLVELPLRQLKRAVQLPGQSSQQQNKSISYFPDIEP